MVDSGVQSCKVTASTFKKCSPLQNFALKLTEFGNCNFSINPLQQEFFSERLSVLQRTGINYICFCNLIKVVALQGIYRNSRFKSIRNRVHHIRFTKKIPKIQIVA